MNDTRAAVLARVEGLITEFGWAAIGIGGSPPYLYTVGYRARCELIIVGLPYQQAHPVMRCAVEKGIEEAGTFANVLHEFNIVSWHVNNRDPDFPARVAHVWRRENSRPRHFDLYQLLWPDAAGVYPPHPAYASAPQPLLSRS